MDVNEEYDEEEYLPDEQSYNADDGEMDYDNQDDDDDNLEEKIANQEKQLPARPNVHFDQEYNDVESIQYEEYRFL